VTDVGLLERVAEARQVEGRFSADTWIQEYLLPANQFTYGGTTYPFGLTQTLLGQRTREISLSLPGYMAALRTCPPAFASQMVRALVLSQARFIFRNTQASPTPKRKFGLRDLSILERPWPNATTGELLSRMEWHAGLAGNAYVVRQPQRLRVLRPDWVAVAYKSEREPDDPALALDAELAGYVYVNGGWNSGNKPESLLPDEVAHWSPLPDPENAGIGMSWITPAVREIQGDRAATEHKLKFFENGATPNLVVKGIPATTKTQFDELVDMMESDHKGLANAYKTLYLTAGADATVVGSDLKQLDFKATQGAGETRIALLSRVPAALLGISDGLAGSSLNQGNFGMARRMFADTWVHPTLQDVAAALAPLITVPSDAELWTDHSDIPILREDAKDAAEIEQIRASTIANLVRDGFTAQSAIAAVTGQDMTLLKHTGLVSVQLQVPGTKFEPTSSSNGDRPALPAGKEPA
jgi:HK97 family phage portal protein